MKKKRFYLFTTRYVMLDHVKRMESQAVLTRYSNVYTLFAGCVFVWSLIRKKCLFLCVCKAMRRELVLFLIGFEETGACI